MALGVFIIGCLCSAIGCTIDNWGMNLQKHSHQINHSKKGEVSYVNTAWATGFAVYLAGQILNFVSLSLIDQPTQSIISSVALFSNIVFARRYFNEEIENKDVVALLMIILAIVLFVMYYQHSDQDITIEELQKHFTTTPFLATAFALLTIYAAAAAYNKCLKPENIRTNISGLAYGVVAAIIGGITITFSKIIAIIVRGFSTGTIGFATSWFLLIVVCVWVFLLVYSVHALNVGLSNSPSMVMVPTFYVVSNLVSIILGIVFYEEYATFKSAFATWMCFISVCLSMGGVYALSLREAADSKPATAPAEDAIESDIEREPMIEHEEQNNGVELNRS